MSLTGPYTNPEFVESIELTGPYTNPESVESIEELTGPSSSFPAACLGNILSLFTYLYFFLYQQ
jgi:hypothetical protein